MDLSTLPHPDAVRPAPTARARHELWLLGQPPLEKYLSYISAYGADSVPGPGGAGANMPTRGELVRQWAQANDYYDVLAEREAGVADHMPHAPLAPALAPLAEALMARTHYREAFDMLPTRVAMVELARLVVCQNHVNHEYVGQLKLSLGSRPSPEQLFRFCLPLDDCPTPVEVREEGSKRYTFRSCSTDLRLHETLLLRPGQLQQYAPSGTLAGVVGVVVGYGSNFLNALEDDDNGRMILNNGYHRACALLELGIEHAPCIVQTVSRRDELDIAARPVVAKDPGYFFNGARPPLLRDFADPRIVRLVPAVRLTKTIEVTIDVHEFFSREK